MMRVRMQIRATIVLLAALLSPAVSFPQSLGLAPAQIVQDFKPGVPFQLDLTTLNDGENGVEMNVQITDFWYNEKNEKTFNAPGTSPRSAANWIQFVPEHFQVGAKSSQKMKAIITPPVDAKGGYYAVLFVESKPQSTNTVTQDGKQVFTNMRIGCLVLLNAEKTAEYNVDFSDVKLLPPSENQNLELNLLVDNRSNTHIFPLPRLAVLDSNHKLVAKADGDAKRFLPGQKDSVRITWAGSLPPGAYTAVLTVSYGNDRIETREVPFTVESR